MSALWSLDALLAAIGGRLIGNAPAEITGISIDSRTVGPGEAFFAIRGDRFDAHAFVAGALKAGAALAVVSQSRVDEIGPVEGALLVVSDDPLDALERLGRAARARMTGKVVAVTGSVGKTSTKEMLRTVFSPLGRTHAPVGSFNNHWGVPLTLARMPADTEFGIFEIGMNHSGEIRPLVGMVRPHAAIVTIVAPVHLAFFADEREIAEAKAEIFEGLLPGGAAIINRDNEWFELLAERAREHGGKVVGFGEDPTSDIRLERCALQEDGSTAQASIFGEQLAFRVGAPGRHLLQNALGVLAVAREIGADVARVALGLAGFRAAKGRGERFLLSHSGGDFILLDESYNANPTSMQAALSLLAQVRPSGLGRRVAVLGDMLELGNDSEALHRGLAADIASNGADLVYLAGAEMKTLWDELPDACRGAYAATAAELEPILVDAIRPGDVIMLKASLGTRFGPVVETIKRRFAPNPQSET
ncbi:UDP-N-acetylmuramoyl-tripeptide--D-alanyl-D-alanine ligase [Faunimonas pinastri]|uniref:UDP-N-acetylmuramoyl-tripeptide--D-alanyl-D-alanine ligase n=1 Tax=Faunimonas pinastri TaxID=1855383 RepID=A0A1H9FS53_9HYPH|nr:UDP-N-acetylmuramoylalanyl-D-glutamyl-2,6-diaminopimelate--D-alanyl-D-alanine ligase [Faunimonas pinastri]SEQ40589.1 UDP-N-acetylmuramoyl-tripeptide--D-alanyl-D-alanine ligase [Faunimonas pinastri]